MTTRNFYAVPEISTGYPIEGDWSVVIPSPVDITNLVTNPSLETDTTGYTAVGGSVARSTVKQRRGAYSLLVTPTAGVSDGFYFGTVSVGAATRYPWSFDFFGTGGVPYKAYWATTAGVQLGTAVKFTGTSRWQRIQVPWEETTATTRRLYVTKDNSARTNVFYVDGLLVPSPAAGFDVWRYFDGDALGFIPTQVDFYWNGSAHGSTSTMKAYTRAGGRITNLATFGFTLLAVLGLGLGTPNNISVPLALPGGEQFQRTLQGARQFDLVGTLSADSLFQLQKNKAALGAALDVRRQPNTQPLILQYQPLDDCGGVVGETVEIVCSPAGGLEGQRDNHFMEQVDLKFRIYVPIVGGVAGTEGAALATRVALTAGYSARRDAAGIWSGLQTSGVSFDVRAILPMPDGRWLIGGYFTDAGGVADADYLAYYNPASDTFTAVNATPLNEQVYTLLQLPTGNVLVGGNFTNAGGFANADFLCLLTVSTGAFTALNATPLNSVVYALALLSDNTVALGGIFFNAGGDANADYLARLTLSTGVYSSFNATPLNAGVLTLATNFATLYIGGSFTNAGGFADSDYLTLIMDPAISGAFHLIVGNSALNATLFIIKALSDGSVLIGGNFTNVNGDTTWDYLIKSVQAWGGYTSGPALLLWSKPFNSINNYVHSLVESKPGVGLVGGRFSSVAGVALFDGLFQFSGNTLIPLDLDLPGSPIALTMGARPNGELIVGTDTTGTGYTSGTSTVTNTGTAPTPPIIVISYAAAATDDAALYSVRNLNTGQIISFNLFLLPGETITINPGANTVISNYRGNLNSTVLPGSSLATFALLPGANRLNIFIDIAAAANATAYAFWQPVYADLDDSVR